MASFSFLITTISVLKSSKQEFKTDMVLMKKENEAIKLRLLFSAFVQRSLTEHYISFLKLAYAGFWNYSHNDISEFLKYSDAKTGRYLQGKEYKKLSSLNKLSTSRTRRTNARFSLIFDIVSECFLPFGYDRFK